MATLIYRIGGDGKPVKMHNIDAKEALATGKWTDVVPGNAQKPKGKAPEADNAPDNDGDPDTDRDGPEGPEAELMKNTGTELKNMAKAAGLTGYATMNKPELVATLIAAGVE